MIFSDYFPRPFHFHPKNWSIGHKIVFLGIATTVISMGALVASLSVVISQYAKVRGELGSDYQKRVDKTVSLSTNASKAFAQDYAYWDEMYEAVEASDTEWFIAATTGSLTTFGSDAFWIYRNDGTLLRAEYKAQQAEPVTFSVEDLSNLPTTESFDYFQYQGDRVVHFTTAPITDPTQREYVTNGFMIVAKVWDSEEIQSIGDIVGASVQYVSGDPENPIDGDIRVQKEILNIRGQPLATVMFTFQDRSLQLVRDSLMAMILISGVLGGGLIYFSYAQQYHWIVHPVRKLIDQLRTDIDQSDSSASFLTSKDELEILKVVAADHIEKLRQNKRLSLAVEASTNGIAVTDLHGSIQYVNAAWTVLNGYSSEEALGKNPSMLQSGKSPKEKYLEMWEALKRGVAYTTESIINRRKDGSEYDCRLSVYPIKEKGLTVGYVGIQQNISHRKEVDRMKTEFISMASHQLRTPLSAMRWFGELLLDKKAGELNQQQRELVQNFYDSTLRMISLVNALLNISRLESGRMIVEPQPSAMKPLVDTVLTELQARIDAKKIKLETDIDANLPIINIDPQLVREVYSNLLTNAVKYTPEGGTIKLVIALSGDTIKSTITDSGVGIPKAEQSKVFSKFFRAKNVTSLETDGTGLGLYLVQTIVNSSQGKIGFESEEGKGTSFWFTLPKSGMEAKSGSVRIGT